MKLLHRPDSLKGLNIQSLRSAGFDTIQYGFTTDDARNIDALWSRIENALSSFTDGNQIDVYLALLLEGDDRVFPDSPYSANAVQLETYQRVTSAAYYDDIEAVIRGIAHRNRAGARLKEVRWNHEYSPVCWKLDSAWTRYARAHASPENYVVENFRSDEWHRFRQAVAPKPKSSTLPKIKARDAYRGPTTSPWNSRDYAEVRTLYRHLVDFQAPTSTTISS